VPCLNYYFELRHCKAKLSELLNCTMIQRHRFVDSKELAEQMGKPISTIRRWARMRVIPQIRAGWRTRLYDPEAVRRALQKLATTED